MTPVFSHGTLRLYLLSLLAEQPRHGYELIQALEERFGGTYSPSPGTIYPRLAKLEDDGLVTRHQDGRKVLYEITELGRAELAARAPELEGVEQQIQRSVRSLADEMRSGLDQAMASLRAELKAAESEARTSVRPAPPSADDQGRARVAELEGDLMEFRAEVRQALRRARHRVDVETARRVRDELSRARSAITGILGEDRG